MLKQFLLLLLVFGGIVQKCTAQEHNSLPMNSEQPDSFAVTRTDEEWKKILTPEQYNILRKKGTERPFTGEFWNHKEKGTYLCAGCGQKLFDSEIKFESMCGWPSFFDKLKEANLVFLKDTSYGMFRTEVQCGQCGSHLGHLFRDGPPPTGLRYCINSAALHFVKANPQK